MKCKIFYKIQTINKKYSVYTLLVRLFYNKLILIILSHSEAPIGSRSPGSEVVL